MFISFLQTNLPIFFQQFGQHESGMTEQKSLEIAFRLHLLQVLQMMPSSSLNASFQRFLDKASPFKEVSFLRRRTLNGYYQGHYLDFHSI